MAFRWDHRVRRDVTTMGRAMSGDETAGAKVWMKEKRDLQIT